MSCKLFEITPVLTHITGEDDLCIKLSKDGVPIDPYFIEATMLVENNIKKDYSILEGLESIEPIRKESGHYYIVQRLDLLPDIPGYYKIIWSVKETQDGVLTGYENKFALVR